MMSKRKITIKTLKDQRVAVIGAGFFGLSAALKLAEKGCQITVYDKELEAIRGASYINQNRMHMGYHYPRSASTAYSSNNYQKAFSKMYQEAVVGNFDHYYCIAKHGSKVSRQEFIEFCEEQGLPHTKEFPKAITLSSEEIDLSIKVPENIYDADLLRNALTIQLKKEESIKLTFSSEVTDIKKLDMGYEVVSITEGMIHRNQYDVVINATYSNINKIVKMAGLKTEEYQYELCEVPIVKVPWVKRTGCGIMDGPFFGIIPFGFSEEYMLYDVEHSVLERHCGMLPEFKNDISFYNKEETREQRFLKYIEKAKKYIAEMADVTYLYSVYITRVVLLDKDHDDARPTEVICHGNGFYSIFAGKMCNAIPAADRIAIEVENYLTSIK